MNGNRNGSSAATSSSLYHDGTGIGGWIDGVLGSHQQQQQGGAQQYAQQQQQQPQMFSLGAPTGAGGWPPAPGGGGGGGLGKIVGDRSGGGGGGEYAEYAALMQQQQQQQQQAAALDRSLSPGAAYGHLQTGGQHYAQQAPQGYASNGGGVGGGNVMSGVAYATMQHPAAYLPMNGGVGGGQPVMAAQDVSLMSPPPSAGPVASAAAAAAAAIPSTGSAASIASLAAGRQMIGGLLDDEVIPTAIVIKNIPFAVQKETLLAIIESLQAPLPYAFNYHHDNGVFRGLAFANFRHPHEADAVVVALNGYDISGRKLRVEYKKVLQAGEKERIEREKAIKRMRSMQFDKGLPQQQQQQHHMPQQQPPSGHASQHVNGSMGPPASTQPRQQGASRGGAGAADGVASPSPSPAYGNPQQQSWSAADRSLDGQMRGLSIDHAAASGGKVSPRELNGGGATSGYLASDQESDRAPSIGGSSTKSGRVHDGSSSSEHGAPLPTTVDFNDPVALDIYSRVLLFKEDRMRDELAFSRSLSQRERRIVHLVAQKLALCHRSVGQADERYVVVTRDQAHASSHYQRAMPGRGAAAASPYSPPPQEDGSVPSSPGGLRIKKSMPNLNNFNGPVVGREQRGLLPKRSSGNLRDYSTVSNSGASAAAAARRSFQAPGANGASAVSGPPSAGQTFKALFGAPLGNGSSLGNGTSFESVHSPTSPVDMGSMQQGLGAPARQPRGPGSSDIMGFDGNTSGRNSAASTRSQGGVTNGNNLRSNPVFAPAPVGSHRGTAAGNGYIGSLSGSVTSASIEEEAATGSDQGSYSSGRSSNN